MSRHHVTMLHTPQWRRLRRVVFDRDYWRCKSCGKRGRLECDHVVPMHLGGAAFDPANLQTLCRGCHIDKTRTENREHGLTPARQAWKELVKELL